MKIQWNTSSKNTHSEYQQQKQTHEPMTTNPMNTKPGNRSPDGQSWPGPTGMHFRMCSGRLRQYRTLCCVPRLRPGSGFSLGLGTAFRPVRLGSLSFSFLRQQCETSPVDSSCCGRLWSLAAIMFTTWFGMGGFLAGQAAVEALGQAVRELARGHVGAGRALDGADA